jgi:hypothetical protein
MKNYVVIPYDPTWRALEWAKEHCPSYITNDRESAQPRPYPDHNTEDVRIRFYFGNERDATAFALKWA